MICTNGTVMKTKSILRRAGTQRELAYGLPFESTTSCTSPRCDIRVSPISGAPHSSRLQKCPSQSAAIVEIRARTAW